MLPDELPLVVGGEFALSPELLLPLAPAPVLLGDELLEPLMLGSPLAPLAPELLLPLLES